MIQVLVSRSRLLHADKRCTKSSATVILSSMTADRKTGQVKFRWPHPPTPSLGHVWRTIPPIRAKCFSPSPALMKLLFSQISVELRRRQDDHVRLRLIQALLLWGAHSRPEEKHRREITRLLLLPPLSPPEPAQTTKGDLISPPQHQTNEPITGNQEPIQPAGRTARSHPAHTASGGFVCSPKRKKSHLLCSAARQTCLSEGRTTYSAHCVCSWSCYIPKYLFY